MKQYLTFVFVPYKPSLRKSVKLESLSAQGYVLLIEAMLQNITLVKRRGHKEK